MYLATFQNESLDSRGNYALHFASIFGFQRTAQYLVDIDVNINVKNENGHTPLAMASKHGHANIVSLLLSHGADTNAVDSRGFTSLMEASKMATLILWKYF